MGISNPDLLNESPYAELLIKNLYLGSAAAMPEQNALINQYYGNGQHMEGNMVPEIVKF